MNQIEYDLLKAERKRKARNHLISILINNFICDHFGITFSQLTNCTRERYIAEPRQISMYLHRTYTTMTFREIGEVFGKDHATVIASIKHVNNLHDTERAYRMQFVAINSETDRMISELKREL